MRVTLSEKQAAAVWALLTDEQRDGQTAPTTLTLTAPKAQVGRPCSCGCGGKTGGGLWLPGHDAKRKSLLFGLVRNPGTSAEDRKRAEAELDRRGWGRPSAGGSVAPAAFVPAADEPAPAKAAKAS